MWNAPLNNNKNRFLAAQRKREQEKMAPKLHLRRVRGEIKTVGDLSSPVQTEARVILSDIFPDEMAFFVDQSFDHGQILALTMDDPKRFYVRGKVTKCEKHDVNTHIIQENTFSYRISIEFVFENEEERAEVRKFCEQIMSEFTFSSPKAA